MSTKPLKPSDVPNLKAQTLPDEVLEAFNEVIAKHFSGGVATFTQEEVVQLLVSKGFDRGAIFAKNLLDVEDIYRKEGWSVTYDKPGYNESYSAKFIFRVKSKR